MNERIEKLAEQAGFTVARAYGLKDTVPKDVFIANVCVSNEMKKFAELIVNHAVECVRDVLRDEQSELTYAAGSEVQKRLREYFGVEE